MNAALNRCGRDRAIGPSRQKLHDNAVYPAEPGY